MLDEAVRNVASAHALDIDALLAAAQRTETDLRRLETALEESFGRQLDDVSVVLTGSFARREVTTGSDCDFLVLVERLPANPLVVPSLVQETARLATELGIKEPGTEGVFGTFSLTSELVARIGLDADSNTNLTRRILLLFESVAVYGQGVREAALGSLLARYCHDYHPGIRTKTAPPSTARFLLNDLIRYWRTVTVDFGAKQWRSVRRDSYLRYAKLLTTRKVLFAGSLMSMLRVKFVTEGRNAVDSYEALLAHLHSEASRTPLARLMSAHDMVSERGQQALADVLASYESFVGLIGNDTTRKRLGSGDVVDDGAVSELRDTVEDLGSTVQDALEHVFFQEEQFAPLTQKYGLF